MGESGGTPKQNGWERVCCEGGMKEERECVGVAEKVGEGRWSVNGMDRRKQKD